jgi:hypothetical protein
MREVIRVYDPETNTFASYNMDGSTKTFFKPRWSTFTRGLYWSQQFGEEFPGRPVEEIEPEIESEISLPIEPIP